jgi:hypothetical protein
MYEDNVVIGCCRRCCAGSHDLICGPKKQTRQRVKDAAKDAYKLMNKGIGSIERPAYHAMG